MRLNSVEWSRRVDSLPFGQMERNWEKRRGKRRERKERKGRMEIEESSN